MFWLKPQNEDKIYIFFINWECFSSSIPAGSIPFLSLRASRHSWPTLVLALLLWIIIIILKGGSLSSSIKWPLQVWSHFRVDLASSCLTWIYSNQVPNVFINDVLIYTPHSVKANTEVVFYFIFLYLRGWTLNSPTKWQHRLSTSQLWTLLMRHEPISRWRRRTDN